MAIDKDSAKNSLFGNIKKAAEQEKIHALPQQEQQAQSPQASNPQHIEEQEPIANQARKSPETWKSKPKWQSFDKVTTLLTTEQKSGLDRIAKKIMKFRSSKLKGNDDKERITANTLIRALVENLISLETSMPMETLSSEKDVQEWVRKVLNQKD